METRPQDKEPARQTRIAHSPPSQKPMEVTSHLLFTTILVASLSSSGSAGANDTKPALDKLATPKAVTMVVRDKSGNHLGSAVSIWTEEDSFWAVTNRHVVQGLDMVCLSNNSKTAHAFKVVNTKGSKDMSKPIDIAFLWSSKASVVSLRVASMGRDPKVLANSLPVVEATGYPSPASPKQRDIQYSSSDGLLIPLISNELEEGFDTAYTASIQKGMSGGGVFVNQQLIAINGAHSEPLWSGKWHNKHGEAVSVSLSKKLDLVSLGISIDVVNRELEKVRELGTTFNTRLKNIECLHDTSRTRTDSGITADS